MTEAAWHEEMIPFIAVLEYIGTFAGAISGIRLASVKRFDWFGAYVIGLVTALGGGTLRDMMLNVEPFWMAAPSYLVATFAAVVAVWLFGLLLRNERVRQREITRDVYDVRHGCRGAGNGTSFIPRLNGSGISRLRLLEDTCCNHDADGGCRYRQRGHKNYKENRFENF